METRTITEVKIYELHLNNMQGKSEESRFVAVSTCLGTIQEFYLENVTTPYEELGYNFHAQRENHRWNKNFLKDGPLEWYNPLVDLNHLYPSYPRLNEQWGMFKGVHGRWIHLDHWIKFCDNQRSNSVGKMDILLLDPRDPHSFKYVV